MKNQIQSASEVKNSNQTRTSSYEKRKIKQWGIISTFLLCFVFFLTNCDKHDKESDEDNYSNVIEFTPEEQMVLWQMRNSNNKISIDEAIILANEYCRRYSC